MNSRHTKRNICVFGATSGIAEQTVRLLAESGHNLTLVARSENKLHAVVNHLENTSESRIYSRIIDLEQINDYDGLYFEISNQMGMLDTVLIFHGYLGDTANATNQPEELDRIVSVNFSSAAKLALMSRSFLEDSAHAQPVLLAIGSVAGDRGRTGNYVYGASKSALDTLFQGMRHEAGRKKSKLKVVLVKAGLTDTAMTAAFNKNGLLWSSPKKVAQIIVNSIENGRPIVYAPGYWRLIMLIIKALPYTILNRLDI